jgi:hypothetical protein
VLQAHAELCLTAAARSTTTVAVRRHIGGGAIFILGAVVESFEPQLKDALRSGLATSDQGQLKQKQRLRYDYSVIILIKINENVFYI